MTTDLHSLLELLDLEEIELNLFRGRSPQERSQRVFGGQVVGQALVAAANQTSVKQRLRTDNEQAIARGVFGISMLIFLIGLMTTIFIRPRWVVLSMLSCFMSIIVMIGYLGLTAWPVTVVSANFVALLLIFGLSICVHLIVRYRELHEENPDRDQRWLVTSTVAVAA